MNKINDDVLRDIFTTFPSINTVWFCGDLNTFYDTDLIVDDTEVDTEDILSYLGFKYDTFDLEFGLVVYELSFYEEFKLPMDEFTRCDRSDFV